MKKLSIILFFAIGISTQSNAQIHLRFGTPSVQYDDTASFGDFISYAFWIANDGPDTLVEPIDINLLITDSAQTNSFNSFLGNYALTNNFLAPNDSLFIISWDHITPMKYSNGDNIVVIWPNFTSPSTPLSYEIFTGDLNVSNTSSVQEKTIDKSLLIYPNPVIETATIQTENQSKINRFRMFDISGKIIRNIAISNQNYVVFKKQELPQGIYFIEITTNEKKYLQKIIIN